MISAQSVIDFLAQNAEWAPYFAFALALTETLALVSLLVPSTPILVAVGVGVATGALEFLPIWIGAALGASTGSTISWWLGRRWGGHILGLWPLRDHPELAERTVLTFRRRGAYTVLLGHYIGPLRPVVFLFAGLTHMPFGRFFLLNVLGAASWAWVIPKMGEWGGEVLSLLWNLF